MTKQEILVKLQFIATFEEGVTPEVIPQERNGAWTFSTENDPHLAAASVLFGPSALRARLFSVEGRRLDIVEPDAQTKYALSIERDIERERVEALTKETP